MKTVQKNCKKQFKEIKKKNKKKNLIDVKVEEEKIDITIDDKDFLFDKNGLSISFE